ncbi:porin family protein [Spongiimicrobium salis]|uniref:porin family protein n=1 Tax=Spongiimicrobium salis TaxID=1667022 RepID=UPI00374CFFC2
MRRFLGVFLLMWASSTIAQEGDLDENYLEDQFYVGITYNFLLERPQGVSQQNLSYGLQLGFIKDLPINSERTFGFGIGLGYAVNSYYSNLVAQETSTDFTYAVFNDNSGFKRNKLENHLVELPLELRWRTSNPESTKFWRIYTGIKFGYAFGNRSKLVLEETKNSFFNRDARDFQSGVTLSFGYNTFNIHAYYGLNSLFNDGVQTTTGEDIGFRPLRLGIIFYIL